MQPVRTHRSRITILGAMLIATVAGGAACGSNNEGDGAISSREAVASAAAALPTPAQLTHGQNLWLKATFGGEQFFSVLLPEALGLTVGLSQVLTTPRSQRFTAWGVLERSELHRRQRSHRRARHLSA